MDLRALLVSGNVRFSLAMYLPENLQKLTWTVPWLSKNIAVRTEWNWRRSSSITICSFDCVLAYRWLVGSEGNGRVLLSFSRCQWSANQAGMVRTFALRLNPSSHKPYFLSACHRAIKSAEHSFYSLLSSLGGEGLQQNLFSFFVCVYISKSPAAKYELWCLASTVIKKVDCDDLLALLDCNHWGQRSWVPTPPLFSEKTPVVSAETGPARLHWGLYMFLFHLALSGTVSWWSVTLFPKRLSVSRWPCIRKDENTSLVLQLHWGQKDGGTAATD